MMQRVGTWTVPGLMPESTRLRVKAFKTALARLQAEERRNPIRKTKEMT